MIIDEIAFNNQFLNKPQQLYSNVFFGSILSLDYIFENNIKFLVGIDIPTLQLANWYQQVKSHPNINVSEILIINFDSKFNNANIHKINEINNNNNDITKEQNPLIDYNLQNTQLLNNLITHLDENGLLEPNIYGNRLNYLKLMSNTFTMENELKFVTLNDFIELFNLTGNKIMIFSDNENNENLITLLISVAIKKNPHWKIFDGLQFIKSMKTNYNNDNLREDKIFWCSGLLNYYEIIRKNTMNWGLNKNNNNNNNVFNNNSNNNNTILQNISIFQPNLSPKRKQKLIDNDKSNFNNTSRAKIARCKRVRSD